MENLTQYTLPIALVCFACYVLPFIIMLMAGVFALWRGSRALDAATSPDAEQMQTQLADLQRDHPKATRDELVRKVIQRQALRCGVIGAVTGIGGVVTLPIALPIDLYTSLLIQAGLVNFIAYAYGHTNITLVEKHMNRVLVLTGGRYAAEKSLEFVLLLGARLIGEALSIAIPFLGIILGFVVNYVLTQAIGRLAAQRYKAAGTIF